MSTAKLLALIALVAIVVIVILYFVKLFNVEVDLLLVVAVLGAYVTAKDTLT